MPIVLPVCLFTDSFQARNEPAVVSAVAPPSHPSLAPRQDLRPGNIPTRLGDSTRRHPSPLSQPVTLSADDDHSDAASSSASLPSKKNNQVVSPPPSTPSPAVEQLAAVSQKDAKKSKSKLRRAFSFGSAAELRKVTAQHNLEKSAAQAVPSKRNSKYEGELEPEQARIAEEQEAAGLGESIYSGQGHFFTGSTDNLSISSTASSASVMLRKMGKGVKKGTRSLVGLFRPKSIVGAAAAGGSASPASTAQVSMVTVEAEREKVHISVDPHDQAGGGTGLPKLDRNSIETNKASIDSGTVSSDGHSRRSIVGGEKERAEVLAAVKKGILKKTDSNQASPKLNAIDLKMPDFNLPQIPHIIDSPRSSAPSTPADETPRSSGHRRMDSITIETNDHDDYFMPMTRLTSIDSKTGAPQTPQGLMRNISFSPRIQFFDTWPSAEYDRRGDIATCNRLTPMLAQQIKEELNTFKMVSLKTATTVCWSILTLRRRWKCTSPPRSTRISSSVTTCFLDTATPASAPMSDPTPPPPTLNPRRHTSSRSRISTIPAAYTHRSIFSWLDFKTKTLWAAFHVRPCVHLEASIWLASHDSSQ